MTRPSTDHAVDALVTRLGARGIAFRRIEAAPWIATLEARLPHRFPTSFRSLVLRYAFDAIELGPHRLFANTGDPERDDELAVRMFADPGLSGPLLAGGFLPIGQCAGYDPLCFDTKRTRGGGECPVVCFDHEPLLMRGDTHHPRDVARSFLELVESGWA